MHSFRPVDAKGKSRYVKFHWRPKRGSQSVVRGEAGKINGANPDFHRRDLWNAIDTGDFPEWETGDFPEWELAVQIFDDRFADEFAFDHLDSTKLIPEEDVPLRVIGRMVLDRNIDNFFAETEQVASCTENVPLGIPARAQEGRDIVRTPQAHPRTRSATITGPNGARDEFHLAAAAQDLRKLARISPMAQPALV